MGFITGEGRVITQRILWECLLRKLLDLNPYLVAEALRHKLFSVWGLTSWDSSQVPKEVYVSMLTAKGYQKMPALSELHPYCCND